MFFNEINSFNYQYSIIVNLLYILFFEFKKIKVTFIAKAFHLFKPSKNQE